MKLKWYIKDFNELSLQELYDLMALRQEVFVVEQDCPYLDADGKDLESYHVLAYAGKELQACARIVNAGVSYPEVSVGRVIAKENNRRKGMGTELMQRCHEFAKNELKAQKLRISAQCYLDGFYKKLGYADTGKHYLEDDIPHQEMTLDLT